MTRKISIGVHRAVSLEELRGSAAPPDERGCRYPALRDACHKRPVATGGGVGEIGLVEIEHSAELIKIHVIAVRIAKLDAV